MKARANNYLRMVVKGNPKLGSFIDVLVTAFNPFYVSGQLQL